MRDIIKRCVLLLGVLLLLSACKASDELPPETEDGVLIYAALNPVTSILEASIEEFNKNHPDVRMEIRDYSDEGGIQRLLVELAAGRVPDIIEMHQYGENGEVLPYGIPLVTPPPEGESWLPYRQMVQQGYLEDLWPFIENDPELGRDGVLEAPLKATEVNGGLYMLFNNVRIITLMGAEQVVGDRCSWTFDELMEAFSTMPEDSSILQYNITQKEVFSGLLNYSLSQYVNWETGETSFDSAGFRDMVDFLGTFPAEFDTLYTPEQVEDEIAWKFASGRQMLEGRVIGLMKEFAENDAYWGGKATPVGFPTADGSAGSLFDLRGKILAMSSTCENKDAAWDYIRKLVRNRHNYNSLYRTRWASIGNLGFYTNKKDYDLANRAEVALGKDTPISLMAGGGYYPHLVPLLDMPSEDDVQRLDTLINSITRIYWPDDALADIVWEAIGPYLAGDKTMDETVRLLDNRVSLYINELK